VVDEAFNLAAISNYNSLGVTPPSLVELCCDAIRNKRELFDVEELEGYLPEELHQLCFPQMSAQMSAQTKMP